MCNFFLILVVVQKHIFQCFFKANDFVKKYFFRNCVCHIKIIGVHISYIATSLPRFSKNAATHNKVCTKSKAFLYIIKIGNSTISNNFCGGWLSKFNFPFFFLHSKFIKKSRCWVMYSNIRGCSTTASRSNTSTKIVNSCISIVNVCVWIGNIACHNNHLLPIVMLQILTNLIKAIHSSVSNVNTNICCFAFKVNKS